MMAAAFAELGLDWRYFRLPVPPELFRETESASRIRLRRRERDDPHKLAALELADEATPAACAVGAANT